MALKPWYQVITPREDLREGRALETADFAVHLDHVRDGRAPAVYQQPAQFFERTFLTQTLTALASEVIRRLSGERTETSAVFNLATQFGGGKTHALTLLYHLAKHGPAADRWAGVQDLLVRSGMPHVPQAAAAVFVGTEFDSIQGRGGDDGTPRRRSPWGEIAFQLGGETSFATVAEHDEKLIAPGGDVIRRMLPPGQPCLILMDELMNYVSRWRGQSGADQLYTFLHNLSETARSLDNVVLVVSIPASEMEMTANDQFDYERIKKMLDRVGKAMIMSAESETSEIIRRRLFEWDTAAVGQGGRVLLAREARMTCIEYAKWTQDHQTQLPDWFPVESAQATFEATYPFHPSVLSVFERKWQALPRFQQTRGVLRLLAHWVSQAYQEGYKGAHRDVLIGLGTAPLHDPLFRAAVFEQLGENRLEPVVTTDITGKADSHAVRLDAEAREPIHKARLHRKVATSIFFESNGGMVRAEATLGEIRLALPDSELLGEVDGVLEALTDACYFLTVERNNRYRFSTSPNLNKLLADRRATIQLQVVQTRVRQEVERVFAQGTGIERVYFPTKSSDIPDRATLMLVVSAPNQAWDTDGMHRQIEELTRQHGSSARTYKSALIWSLPDSVNTLESDARKLLAWEAIQDEAHELRLDEVQQRQLVESVKKAQREFGESIWRAYKHLVLLGKDNQLRHVDLGLPHSSAAPTMLAFMLMRLQQDGDLTDAIGPGFLVRNWPPAFTEWSTRSLRNAFFASPVFPRLLKPDALKDTIARGVSQGVLGYVGKIDGEYRPFHYKQPLAVHDVEISDDMFIITAATAESYVASQQRRDPEVPAPTIARPSVREQSGSSYGQAATDGDQRIKDQVASVTTIDTTPEHRPDSDTQITGMEWAGTLPPQKWTTFYTRVLTKLVNAGQLNLAVRVNFSAPNGLSPQKIEEIKLALRELGLPDQIDIGSEQGT